MTIIANAPFPTFLNLDGAPLEDGYLYFGYSNQNPETNPITVYWDGDFTTPAAQPIRTSGGYPIRDGSPANMFVSATDYSITVRDKNRRLVYSNLFCDLSGVGVSQLAVADIFTGDGTTTVYTLSDTPASLSGLDVSIGGVVQTPGVDYTLINGSDQITFTSPPPSGVSILVRFGRANEALAQISYTTQPVTATAGQTLFNLNNAYTPGANTLAVYLNGLRLRVGFDYTETSTTQITLTAGAVAGDELYFVTGTTDINPVAVTASSVAYTPAGTGAIVTNVQEKLREWVSVKDFGASPSATVDVNTVAIQAAADYATNTGAYLLGAPGVYTVNATIVLNCNGDLGEMTIQANAGVVSPIVRFGTTSGFPTSYKIITLPRVRNNSRASGTWGAGVGIELANCNANTISIPSVTECGVGVTCGGYNSGFAYNNVNLMFLHSNKINLRLMPAAITGWSNQNVFIGGRFGISTTDFTISGYVGTRNILLDQNSSINGGPNNNTFIGASLETNLIEYMIAFDESASYNQFINCRYEGSAKNVLFNSNTASGISSNLFIGGYQVESLVFTTSGSQAPLYNSMLSARRNDFDGSGVTLNIVNRFSADVTAPHLQGFDATTNPLGKTNSATDWTYRAYANGLSGKRSSDSNARLILDYQNGRLYAGNATAAPTRYIGAFGTLLGSAADWVPHGDNTYALGTSTYRWTYVHAYNVRTHSVTVSTLPTAATAGAGTRAYVVDSTVTASGNFGAIVAGGGANPVPVYSDGTNWRIG